MNASSWTKAVDLVAQGTQANQQVQAAATADSGQLESFSLNSLSADDSSPPQVNYGTEQPLTVSTPRASSTSTQKIQCKQPFPQVMQDAVRMVFLLRPRGALVLGNGCERFCASRPLLGSYVHQESI